jgi:hypothetical protein
MPHSLSKNSAPNIIASARNALRPNCFVSGLEAHQECPVPLSRPPQKRRSGQVYPPSKSRLGKTLIAKRLHCTSTFGLTGSGAWCSVGDRLTGRKGLPFLLLRLAPVASPALSYSTARHGPFWRTTLTRATVSNPSVVFSALFTIPVGLRCDPFGVSPGSHKSIGLNNAPRTIGHPYGVNRLSGFEGHPLDGSALSIAQNDPFSDHKVRQTMAVIVNAHAPSFARAAKIQFA